MRTILPFTLSSPIHSPRARIPQAYPLPTPYNHDMTAHPSHAYNTLVVEDDVVTRHLLTQALRRRGHHVTACASAEEAMELLSTLAFPLAIVDLNLPGMDGASFCRWLRQQPRGDHCYILVGTTSTQNDDLRLILQAGANDYVNKPYLHESLNVRLTIAEQQVIALEQRQQLESQLKSERDFISAVVETAPALIVVLDRNATILRLNRACRDTTGYLDADLLGAPFLNALIAREDFPTVQSAMGEVLMRDALGTKTSRPFECKVMTKAGEPKYISWSASTVPNTIGDVEVIICAGLDITARFQAEERLNYLALRDPLTRLYNRAQLTRSVDAALENVRHGIPSCVLYIDLDNLKIVNDSLGHAAGDRLLVKIADLLRESLHEKDVIVRFGGDEFVVVLNDTTLENAKVIAERTRVLFDNLVFRDSDRTFSASASFGLTKVDTAFSSEQLMAQADAACYAAKNKGRNRVEVTHADQREIQQLHADSNWLARVKEAIKDDKFELWFQPVVSTSSRSVFFQEALLRLRDHDGSIIEPQVFLPSVQRSKLTKMVDKYVINKSIFYLRGHPDLILSLNISADFLSDSNLPKSLHELFLQNEVDPCRVIFEVTEEEIASNFILACKVMQELRAQGFRFALDDFGAGFSSFAHLRDLPVDLLKIDGSFTKDVADKPSHRAIILAINEMAHHMGLETVAEYVQSEEIFEILQDIGVDYTQGYLHSRPRPKEDLPCAKSNGC
ncbi:MAG: putative bifunctional diguanylate cyclase/phosphodiesterase [Candidatus Methylacidiphilales bacterium]